jgi:hypothetical protein
MGVRGVTFPQHTKRDARMAPRSAGIFGWIYLIGIRFEV